MRILGIDPGLRCTGWGVIDFNQGRLQHIANGAIRPDPRASDADRLTAIYQGLSTVIADTDPDIAAIEEIFVAKSARSALRLGMARGVGILACGTAQVVISEIAARAVISLIMICAVPQARMPTPRAIPRRSAEPADFATNISSMAAMSGSVSAIAFDNPS